jgi:hypothetical protein
MRARNSLPILGNAAVGLGRLAVVATEQAAHREAFSKNFGALQQIGAV